MKDTIHYQIGQKIGDFTISSYNSGEGHFTLTYKVFILIRFND